jgi:transposase-like protein
VSRRIDRRWSTPRWQMSCRPDRSPKGVELLGPDGLLSQVTKAVLERALGEVMSQHLGYDKYDPAGRGSGNRRNRSSGKRLLTDIDGIDLDVPRDRNGSFAPQIVPKGQTRPDGFNDRIVALYARGLSTRDIRAHLREMYDVDVCPDLISRVTDAVLEEPQESQTRPLDRVYPVVFTDTLRPDRILGKRNVLGRTAHGMDLRRPTVRMAQCNMDPCN